MFIFQYFSYAPGTRLKNYQFVDHVNIQTRMQRVTFISIRIRRVRDILIKAKMRGHVEKFGNHWFIQ
jgi:hypothetical protein